MIKRVYIIVLLIITMGFNSWAQSFTAKTSKSNVIVGEQFQITFTLNSSGSDFSAPDLTYFNVYAGPNQSSSMSYVNGAMTQSVSLSYIVSAKKEGKYSIGAATVKVKGKTIRSNSLNIDVAKRAPQQQRAGTISDKIEDNLFAKTTVNKTRAYIGEEITVTYKIYTRHEVRGFQNYIFPDYKGFWVEDWENKRSIEATNEVVNGVNYRVGILKRTFVFAQRSGKLEIGEMHVDCLVRKKNNRQPRNIVEQMMGVGFKDVLVPIKSKPISITIVPLPEKNKPDNFSGAVGSYSYKAVLSKNKTKANEAVNLNITISGKGNIKLLSLHEFKFPEDFEVYDPKIKNNVKTSFDGVRGSKSFNYLLIPRHEGDYEINKLDFSYFNPNKKKYVTITAPTYDLAVEKGQYDPTANNIYTQTSKEEVKILANDIRYIKTGEITLRKKNNFFFGSPFFYTGIISPFLAFFGFLFYRKKQAELNKDVVTSKSRKANKIAKKRLILAEQLLQANKKEAFYIEIFKALYGYLGDKLNINPADLSKEHIAQSLQKKSVNENTIKKLTSTIDTCEYARYAPSTASEDLTTIYDDTVELIMNIENEIK